VYKANLDLRRAVHPALHACLDRRIADLDTLTREGAAWQAQRNATQAKIDWQFTIAQAHVKLERLYPSTQV
jgi:hypothetical protein